MTNPTRSISSFDAKAASSADSLVRPTAPDTEPTDPDLSPPPELDRTFIERPSPTAPPTVVETPSDEASKATAILPEAAETAAFLVIWPGEQHARRVVVEIPVTYIGRVPGNQILLDDSALSRHHARIAKEGTQYVLYDQNSRNGTFVYDGRTRQWLRVTRQVLVDGDEIRLGRTRMRFKLKLSGR